MKLSLRGGRGPFVLEKWYLDVLMPDGAVLILYLGWMRLMWLSVARFTAELFRPGAEPVRGEGQVDVIEGGVDLVICGHTHTYERFRLRRGERELSLINLSGRPQNSFLFFGK